MSDKEFYSKFSYGYGDQEKGSKMIWKGPKNFRHGNTVNKESKTAKKSEII